MYINVTISNPDQKFLTLTSIQFSLSDSSGSLSDRRSLSIKGNEETITASIKNKIYDLNEFYRIGSKDITISGTVTLKEDSDSYDVPFERSTTIHPVTNGTNQIEEPTFSNIKFEIDKLTNESGVIESIIVITNISIYNPNPIPIALTGIDYSVSDMIEEKNELEIKKLISSGFYSTNQVIIAPMDTYLYSGKKMTSKVFFKEDFEYFSSKELKYINVKGTATFIAAKVGWNPTYFKSDFDTIITMNGSHGSSTNGQRPAFVPDSTLVTINESNFSTQIAPTPEKDVPGFRFVYAFVGLFIIALILRTKKTIF